MQALQRAGHIAYFAGGCVRDMLWNLTPKDYDVATDAPPQRVRELFPRSQGVGQAFGVVLVRFGQSIIEVATFRADGSYSDGRRPDDVRFATPQEDAQRRDFTINGLFFDPLADRVIDFVAGQPDLNARVLRAIGDPARRFAEDYLRMLRAVRFTSRFELKLDESTALAIRQNAHKLPRIAPERICDELRASFQVAPPARCVAMLDGLGLTPILLRGTASQFESAPARPLLPNVPGSEFVLALIAMLVETLLAGGESLAAIFARGRTHELVQQLRLLLRLSNDETSQAHTILSAGELIVGQPPSVSTIKRFIAQPAGPLGIRFLQLLQAAGMNASQIAGLLQVIASFPPDQIAPEPLLDGSDLQQAGYVPGPAFKHVLDEVYNAQLESRIATEKQAMDLAHVLMNDTSARRPN